MGLFFRFWRIVWGLVPPITMMIRDYHLSLVTGETFQWETAKRRRRARKLVDAFAHLGPTFIKLAQVLAARADLFPGIYLSELRRLHDAVPPMKTRRIKRHFRRVTGTRVEEAFDSFEEECIASASLGQVHGAMYRGMPVAVKILKPRIRETVDKDLQLLAAVLSIATIFFKNPQLSSLITIFYEFSKTIHEEMDLKLEAEHVAYFRRRYEGDDRVVIPAVVGDISNRDVLVLEFLEGIRISDVEAVRAAGHDTVALTDRLVTIFAEQILRDGVFHADPHPGNIFVTSRGQIGLVDFGLVLTIPAEDRHSYIEAVVAAARRDYDALVDKAFELGLLRSDVNPLMLRQAAKRLMAIALRDDLGPLQMQRIVHQVMQVFYELPLQLPGDLVYVLKTMSLVEGLGATYRPRYNLLKDGLPILKRLLEPELERLETRVLESVIEEGKAAWNLYENLKFVMELAAREELTIRIYRGDIDELERIAGYTVRRLIALLIVFGGGLTCGVIFLHTGYWWVLLLGSVFSIFAMLGLFLLPNVPKTPRIIHPRRRSVG